MYYFYVKNGGTATGNGGRSVLDTPRTGSFAAMGASAYYADLAALLAAVTLADGDKICFSRANITAITSGSVTYTIPANVELISVSDTNCDQEEAGARIENSGAAASSNIEIAAADLQVSLIGLDFDARGSVLFGGSGATFKTRNCIWGKIDAGGEGIQVGYNGSNIGISWFSEDDALDFAHDSNQILVAYGSHVELDNIGAEAGHVRSETSLFRVGGTNYRRKLVVKNSVLTDVYDPTPTPDFLDIFAGDSAVHARFERCTIGASWGWVNNTPNGPNIFIDLVSCDTGDGYYKTAHYDSGAGECNEDTARYLDATYDGTTGVSLQMVSNAKTNNANPLSYKLWQSGDEDLTGANAYEIEFTCANTLETSDFGIRLVQNDATDNALGITKTSQPSITMGGSGAAHTASTATWGGSGDLGNKYRVSLTSDVVAGLSSGQVEIWVDLFKPSETVNVDFEPNIS